MRRMGMIVAGAMLAAAGPAPKVEVETADVATFYRIYDAAHGAPSGEVLQRGYIDKGSEGVRQFVPNRILSGAALAQRIARDRPVYEQARACLSVLPAVKARLAGYFQRLAALDPQATFPPVTILIGRNTSGGTTGKSGVLIGLEVVCRSTWLQPDLTERLYHLIAHEYGHVQQPEALDGPGNSVLKQSLLEGVAELIAELGSGQVSNVQLQRWTRGHEQEIDWRFMVDADKTDLSDWLYNGPGSPEHPGDLGYWVGYRIAKAYYGKAKDKRAALRDLLEMKDPKAILAQSGWTAHLRRSGSLPVK
ncbi:DUF2268 domain-containing putative Zn-dependent protease [Sphingomonas sp.]|uniref:gliding motility protein GldB-related protein n=1 Tax=Sphingomonas sp. TaxID=28214 RepID=UPI003B3A9A69